MPKRLVSLFKTPLFKLGIFLGLAVAAILIVLSMMLGNEAGQFVIRVQSGDVDKSISITDNLEDKSHYGPKLNADGMVGMNDYSPEYFLEADYETLEQLCSKPGMTNYDHDSLYIYTFYIKNTSTSGSVGVRAQMNISHVTNYADEIVRVLTYTTGYGIYDPNVYQKKDDLDKLGLDKMEYPTYVLTPINFKNETTIFDDQHINISFGEGQDYVRYSVLFWLEGEDPDSDFYGEVLYNGTIRFELTLFVEM